MSTTAKNTRLRYILLTATALLAIPLVAMLFTDSVNWSLFDFIVAGILLYGTGIACEFVLRKASPKYKLIACAGILFLLFIIWAELAVGVFGTPFAGS